MIDRLQIKELQELVGDDTLDRLKNIIPYIPNTNLEHPNDIYEKQQLVKIFLSFSGQDSLSKNKFRAKILNRLSSDEITFLANKLNIDPTLELKQLVNKISRLKWGDNEETKIIIDFLKLPEEYLPSAEKKLNNIENVEKPEIPFKILKDFQIRIFENCMSKLKNPIQRFIIQMPTGSGKTRTSMEIIASQLNDNPGKSVMWIANSEELCEQAVESFKDVWEHIGNFDVDLIRAWGSNNLQIPVKSSFIVGGFAKLNSTFKKDKELPGIISKHLVMILVDEAHQVVAPTYKKVVDSLLKSNYASHLIGLTATPGRSNLERDETKDLSDFFSGTMIEINPEDKTVFEFLRDKKILSHIEKDPLIYDKYYELTEKEKKYVDTWFDFPSGLLERISLDDARNLEIIKKLKNECESDKKVIFFGASIDQSKFICAILNFMGYRAEHVDGNTGRDRRRNIVKQFKDGNLNVICNFGVLTTGFDAPKTDVIFIARPTMSVVLYSQMVGRGLRGPAIGGTQYCKLIDVIDNLDAYKSPENVYDYFEEYWNI